MVCEHNYLKNKFWFNNRNDAFVLRFLEYSTSDKNGDNIARYWRFVIGVLGSEEILLLHLDTWPVIVTEFSICLRGHLHVQLTLVLEG